MNHKELRIGNLILCQGLEMEVNEIRWRHGTWEISDTPIDQCDPIELTEQRLVDFGFKKVVHEDLRFDEWDIGEFSIIQNENGFEFYPYHKPIKTVHRLQNLYYSHMEKELKTK